MSVPVFYFTTFDTSLQKELRDGKKYKKADVQQILNFPRKVYEVLVQGKTWNGYKFIPVKSFQEVPRGAKWFEMRLCPKPKIKIHCATIKGNLSCAFLGGHNIYINLDRWLYGSDIAGIPLGLYQIYVINHEVGHILGRVHPQKGFTCNQRAQKSPVMQQQSLRLNGCSFNPYPLDNE